MCIDPSASRLLQYIMICNVEMDVWIDRWIDVYALHIYTNKEMLWLIEFSDQSHTTHFILGRECAYASGIYSIDYFNKRVYRYLDG